MKDSRYFNLNPYINYVKLLLLLFFKLYPIQNSHFYVFFLYGVGCILSFDTLQVKNARLSNNLHFTTNRFKNKSKQLSKTRYLQNAHYFPCVPPQLRQMPNTIAHMSEYVHIQMIATSQTCCFPVATNKSWLISTVSE